MTLDMWIVLAILAGAIFLFVTEWIRVDVVALSVVVVLMVTGILTTDEALAGFSNGAVLTIASLFIVGGAVLHTGLAGRIGRQVLTLAGDSERRLIAVLMLTVALLSSFMSDTGTVAVLLPATMVLARGARIAPSKLLIPLAFGSLLGGASTLIGTPPNIIVSDLLREEGLEPFSFFDFTPMGLILVVTGILFMITIGRKSLPDRRRRISGQRIETPEELVEIYRLPDNMFRLRVRRNSELIGMSIQSIGFGKNHQVTVLDIKRRLEPRTRFRFGDRQSGQHEQPARISVEPEADTTVRLDDVLVVQGNATDIAHLAATSNLAVQPATAEDEDALVDDEAGVAEIILPPRSSLDGKTLVETRFGQTYGLTVLGLSRAGELPQGTQTDFKNRALEVGDTLLVQGPWKNIMALKEKRRDFIVTGQPEAMIGGLRREKAGTAMVILLAMVVLMVAGILPVTTATMLAGLAMVVAGCLTMDQAYEAIDWKSLVLVAGMLPMSTALGKVGLVELAAEGLVDTLGTLAPQAVMAGLFLSTSLFTQVLSNTATTVIIAPIAFASAITLGASPNAFLMSVAIAASMAFASPVASPVNTIIMGAGDYRFIDYAKVGVPLILVTMLLAIIFLPIIFPF